MIEQTANILQRPTIVLLKRSSREAVREKEGKQIRVALHVNLKTHHQVQSSVSDRLRNSILRIIPNANNDGIMDN